MAWGFQPLLPGGASLLAVTITNIDAVTAHVEISAQAPAVATGANIVAVYSALEINAVAPTFENPSTPISTPGIAQAGLIWLWGVESDTIIVIPDPAGVTVEALSPNTVIGNNVLAPVSNLEIQAQVPLVIGFNTRPPVAELQIVAQAPAVATGFQVAVPAPGALQIAAQTPAVAVGYRAAVPAPAELSVAAQAPAVATGANVVQLDAAGLEIAAPAPAVYANDITVSGPAGIEIDAPTPSIVIGADPGFNPGKGRRTPLLRPGRGLNPG